MSDRWVKVQDKLPEHGQKLSVTESLGYELSMVYIDFDGKTKFANVIAGCLIILMLLTGSHYQNSKRHPMPNELSLEQRAEKRYSSLYCDADIAPNLLHGDRDVAGCAIAVSV